VTLENQFFFLYIIYSLDSQLKQRYLWSVRVYLCSFLQKIIRYFQAIDDDDMLSKDLRVEKIAS